METISAMYQLMDHLSCMNREMLPERIFYRKGTGALGYFQPYFSMSDYTCADFLSDPERRTPVLARFSTFTGGSGSPDTARDLREFSVRFYTRQGNFDLMGRSLPVFFISDPEKLTLLHRSIHADKATNLNSATQFWSFVADHPESIHLILWLFSDLGTMKSYRTMPGYSNHVHHWVNKKCDDMLVRYEWSPKLGVKTITRQEAEFLAGYDPDVAIRDLHETLAEGGKVEYELTVHLLPRKRVSELDPYLDPTKGWPAEAGERCSIGTLVLDRNPDDYVTEIDHCAFSPGNLVPGIKACEDAMQQAMIHLYQDSNRYRLGHCYQQLAVNRSVSQDRSMPVQSTSLPLKSSTGPATGSGIPLPQVKDHIPHWNEKEKKRVVDNILEHLMFVEDEVQKRVLSHLMEADLDLGIRIRSGLSF